MSLSSDTTPMKTCANPECGKTFPATAEYFARRKDSKDGLASWCKECAAAYHRQYQEANREKIAEYKRQYQEANREKIAEYHRQYREDNPEKVAERKRRYYEVNREKEIERTRRWSEAHREEKAENNRRYREDHRETIAERKRRWGEANPEKRRIANSRYRARKRGLPDTFTDEQWIQCLEYFNYCCPVCDNQLRGLWGDIEPHGDHWIPMSYEGDDNPGTVASNMICLCNHCNQSKFNKMPDVWLKEKFGRRKAKPIMARIEAYFEWCEAAA